MAHAEAIRPLLETGGLEAGWWKDVWDGEEG